MMRNVLCILVLGTAWARAEIQTGVLPASCKDVASFVVNRFGLSNKPLVTSSAADRRVTITYLKPTNLTVTLLFITSSLCGGEVTAVDHVSERPLVNALKARFHK
jgi:hypothetical protein